MIRKRTTKKTAAARQRGRTLEIATPRVFLPLLHSSARYKGAYGGRGSGKSHFFAELLIEDCLAQPGMLGVCIREVQKSLKDSSKRLIEVKLRQLGLGEADGFKVFEKQIQTPGGGVIVFCGMQESNAENIKSLEGFQRAWIEEAQALSQRSLALLRPTIRAKGSQIWASWNPGPGGPYRGYRGLCFLIWRFSMTLRLTPDMLAAGYDFLRETPPFKSWKLPSSDDVGFHVVRDPRIHADFGAENGTPIIRVSENGAGHTVSLLAALAHEAIHLHQWRKKLDRGGAHNADFKKRAWQACRAHGFDPKTF